MKPQLPASHHHFDQLLSDVEVIEQLIDDDLWFLPGQIEEEAVYLPPGPRAEPRETAVVEDWA